MVRFLFTTLFALATYSSFAQSSVDFDTYVSETDNDLTNRFHGTYDFHQAADGGVTGGCIILNEATSPPSMSENLAVYNDSIPIRMTKLKASVDFRYGSPGDRDYDGVKIVVSAIKGDGTEAHDWISVSYNPHEKEMMVAKEGQGSGASHAFGLDYGYWYRLELEIEKDTMPSFDTVKYIARLYNLGYEGMLSPVLWSTVPSNIFWGMSDFFDKDYRVVVGISGNTTGGVSRLDNFNLETTVPDEATSLKLAEKKDFILMPTYCSGNTLQIASQNESSVEYVIYSLDGRQSSNGSFSGNTNVDVSKLANGNYLIRFVDRKGIVSMKRLTIGR